MKGKNCHGKKELECLNTLKNIMSRFESGARFFYLAAPNEKSSEFPDFIFEDGFIEHFQISSSKETKKGSDFNIAKNDFNKDMKEKFDKNKNEWLASDFQSNTLGVKIYETIFDDGSYEFYIKSFKKNFDKHITSLRKYNGEKSIGIFLVEFLGGKITILENNVFKEFYKLSYDKELLEYIYQFKDELKYVVFTDNEHYDIVELHNIPTIVQTIPQGITFGIGGYITTNSTLFLDIDIHREK